MGAPKIWEWTPFQTLLEILRALCGNFRYFSRCGVTGGEQVPTGLLGWYSVTKINFSTSQCPLCP